jgi:hypothetical protein
MNLTIDAQLLPLGYQKITTLTGAVRLTPPEGAVYALIICESQPVRWRDDGTVPTATVGFPLPKDKEFWYVGNLNEIAFIETTATAAVDITYYKPK